MDNIEINKAYWEQRYEKGETGWDTGRVSPPLKAYIDQITNKDLNILIPGCGSAYEAEYLCDNGFHNVTVIDVVGEILDQFIERCPEFPPGNAILSDFFTHSGQYDLILEQTFFSSFSPNLRTVYAEQANSLLVKNGKIAGVLFNFQSEVGPPYGGSIEEYEKNFNQLFNVRTLEECYNSNESWRDLEVFIILVKIN